MVVAAQTRTASYLPRYQSGFTIAKNPLNFPIRYGTLELPPSRVRPMIGRLRRWA